MISVFRGDIEDPICILAGQDPDGIVKKNLIFSYHATVYLQPRRNTFLLCPHLPITDLSLFIYLFTSGKGSVRFKTSSDS
ncbi:hypothetical protein Hdeb2414_s0024g00647141 [Helianthus debilis subsp. tardiflorus]